MTLATRIFREAGMNQVAVARRSHRGKIELLRVRIDDAPGERGISALAVFSDVWVAEDFISHTEGVGLGQGWRAVMVDAEALADILEALELEHVAIPMEPGLGGDAYLTPAAGFLATLD
jgi:hypothetical protein